MATPNEKLGLDELASQYGYAAGFFNSDPELKSLISQAVTEQWSTDKFRAKFTASNWYRSKSASLKQWNELKSRDPAEAQRQIEQKALTVENLATQMGARLGPGHFKQFAEQALWSGWSDEQIKQVLVDWNYDDKGSGGQGQAGTVDSRIRQIAADYGVSLGDKDINDFTRNILKGGMTEDNVASFAKQMAMSKYAGMKGYLEQGFTVKQVASPYVQSYAQLLEADPNTVKLTDPLIQKALQGTPDAKAGGLPAMQSLYQFEQAVRQDNRWLGTKNAHGEAENIAMRIAQDWGIHG